MNVSKKYIYLFWIGLLAACLMTACKPESRDGVPDDSAKQISIQFSSQFNEVVLRAFENGSVEEDIIDHVDLFIFNTAGAYVDHKFFDKANIDVVNSSTFDVKVSVTQGVEYTFVALANMPAGTNYPVNPTIDGLRQMKVDGLPVSPFVMFGETVATVQSNNDIVHVPMSRSCAAIDLANIDPNFTLEEGFWIYNLEQNGYVDVADPSTVTGFASSLSPEIRLEGSTARAYTHPRNITVSDATPATYIIFKGKKANGHTSYYRTEVNVVDGQQVFEKNHIYRVMITKVTEVGYTTLEEAIAATADKKVVFTVSDWDDKNQTDVAFFGNYYLKVSSNNFFFDMAQQSTIADVYTNAPGVNLIPPVNLEPNDDGTYSPASWSTISLTDKVDSRFLNIGVFENNEQKERNAFFYVRATGIHTDDLKIRIGIKQLSSPKFVSDAPSLIISPIIFFGASEESFEYVSNVTTLLSRQEWRIDVKGGPVIVWYTNPDAGMFVESITTPNGHITFAEDGTPVENTLKTNYGSGSVKIKTRPVTNKEPNIAKFYVISGEGANLYYQAIYIYQNFTLSYDIDYPSTLNAEMQRDKYVIETPLEQSAALDYKVNVTSNVSWKATIEPAEAASWITLTDASHEVTATLGDDETSSFTVTVQKNSATPLIDTYPPARQAKIRITATGGGGERSKDIVVYQGGYVTIGEDIWMDRNLKTGYWYSNQYYPMLYPYAIPVGLPTSAYGAYAKSNTVLPRISGTNYGDDGYFVSGAPQSGYLKFDTDYYGNIYNQRYYYRSNTAYYFNYLDLSKYDWDPYYSDYNPCPPGWQVPWLSQWNPIIDLVNSGYFYGKPTDVSQNPDLSAQNGEMMVHNAGRYITIAPMTGTDGGPIDWYLPAAGSRIINGADMIFPGVFGQYKAADLYHDGDQNRHFYFSNNKAFIYPDNVMAAGSVRCVRVK